ncbi:MAG: prolyl oligopeptidase family serine peptidase [Oscillospiraceae bacterium]|nr:prolyl oligopeptidase family serine peptidase [Oscillospiraceae bacterium]
MEKYFTINAEKLSIRCKAYFDNWKTPHTVIVCGHGFGGHKDNKAVERFAGRVLEKNKSVLILCFNWPGHGDDALKRISLDACDDYLRLVLAYIDHTWTPERLLGYATSFGGYLFLRYLSTHGNPFELLALRCPAVPMYEVLTGKILDPDAIERLSKGKPVSAGFDRKVEITSGFLEELKAEDIRKRDFLPYADDLLILHGVKDEIVPFEAVAAFADAYCLELIPFEKADHRFLDPRMMDLAIAQILEFFRLR